MVRIANKYKAHIKSISTESRIEEAKSTIKTMTNRVIELVDLEEQTKIFVFSNAASSKVPRSFAANAFSRLQKSVYNYQFIRTVALWDEADHDTYSLPTAYALLNDNSVKLELSREIFNYWKGIKYSSIDREDEEERKILEEIIRKMNHDRGEKAAHQLTLSLEGILSSIDNISESEYLLSLQTARHKLAHNITRTRKERTTPIDLARMRDEQEILSLSICLIEGLYAWVNGVNFDIDRDVREGSRKCALDFWSNFELNIP